MKINPVDIYFEKLPADRKEAMHSLRKTILDNIPKGFSEVINSVMIGYVVPHSIYPGGYHCDPKQPLPFICIASQKNFISLYHMGIYADPKLLDWFTKEYPKYVKLKLDMGKSCIRFKNADQIPLKLIAELISKVSVEKWIEQYESALK